MKLFSWAFNNLEQQDLLDYLLTSNNLHLDKVGSDALGSLVAAFLRNRCGAGYRHEILWAATVQTSRRYMYHHSARIFSRYPQYTVSYFSFNRPPVSPDWILLRWTDAAGVSREVMRQVNIQIPRSAANRKAPLDLRRSSNHEDA